MEHGTIYGTTTKYFIPQSIMRHQVGLGSYCSVGCEYNTYSGDEILCTLFQVILPGKSKYGRRPCEQCDAALKEHLPYQKLLEQ
jgi:hypothetical protein